MHYTDIISETDERIAPVTLNRRAKRKALDNKTL